MFKCPTLNIIPYRCPRNPDQTIMLGRIARQLFWSYSKIFPHERITPNCVFKSRINGKNCDTILVNVMAPLTNAIYHVAWNDVYIALGNKNNNNNEHLYPDSVLTYRYEITHQIVSRILLDPKSGIILWMRPANERRRYIVTSALIGWAHTQNDPCKLGRHDDCRCRSTYDARPSRQLHYYFDYRRLF